MTLYPLLNDVPLLFYYLWDLIVYEQFFRNDLLTSCLSIAGCCSNREKIENVYTIGAKNTGSIFFSKHIRIYFGYAWL